MYPKQARHVEPRLRRSNTRTRVQVSEWDRGQVDAVREWYKVYKVAEGKPTNEYIHGGEALDAAYAQTVIWQTFQEYARLISGHVKDHGLSLQ